MNRMKLFCICLIISCISRGSFKGKFKKIFPCVFKKQHSPQQPPKRKRDLHITFDIDDSSLDSSSDDKQLKYDVSQGWSKPLFLKTGILPVDFATNPNDPLDALHLRRTLNAME